MNRRAKNKYVYGKTHHVKYLYKERIGKIFDECREKINQLSSDHRINNLLVNLRNEAGVIIDEIYQQLSIQLKHGINISSKKRMTIINVSKPENQSCQICGEKRAVDKCHIIPREFSGDDDASNMIYLCPTHHHLFDHCELSDEEFGKIVLIDKKGDSVEYFETAYKPYHQMIKLLGTAPNGGCPCGVHSLGFCIVEISDYICTCFMCHGCKKKYAIPFNGLVQMKVVKVNVAEKSVEEATENIREALIKQFGKTVISDLMF